MKTKLSRIPINYLLTRNKVLLILFRLILYVLFFVIRVHRRLRPLNSNRVVVLAFHKLGDTIFTIPAIRELQKLYDQNITIACYPDSTPIYQQTFNNIEFCELSRKNFLIGGRLANREARKKIEALKPEIIIDITGTMISASLLFSSRAKKHFGINSNLFSPIFDEFIEIRENPRLVDIYLDAISPVIRISDRDFLDKTKKTLNPEGKILVQPFAGWKVKEWNFKRFLILTQKLNYNYQTSIIVQKGQLASDIVNEINYNGIELIQTESVEQLIQNLMVCSLFIGNDSGPLNIANYFGIPTLTIYGATNPDFTASDAEHQIYLQKELKCSARLNEKYCLVGADVFSCSGTQCMSLITVDDVYDVSRVLAERYSKKKV